MLSSPRFACCIVLFIILSTSCILKNINTSSSEFVKIKVYDHAKKGFLSDYKLVTSCNPHDEPFWAFDNRKGFYTKNDSIVVLKKELFAKVSSKTCSPWKPSVIIVKDKKYFIFEIFESTNDTIYYAN